ncbi:hypothetical protein EDB84DRAFT_682843 [Lactarius hengduanensis]|nr:hypothetical protein EDB84DRAFT_682843 [Lactarius hengduanensis]
MRTLIPLHLPITTDSLSTMPSKHFFRNLKQRACKSRPAMSGDQAPLAAQGTTVVPDQTWQIDTHDDITMGAIQTSLVLLKEGSSLATKLPFIAPIAGLLLQALTMRDEVKQYKRECEIVMGKLARIAGIIVDVCEKYNLSSEELPTTLRNILSSLQRELDRIERVLKMCSKRKGIRGMLLRKDLLTNIRQCDVELSNVLQAFQVELGLDIRIAIALIVQRRESQTTTDSDPIEATPSQSKSCEFGTPPEGAPRAPVTNVNRESTGSWRAFTLVTALDSHFRGLDSRLDSHFFALSLARAAQVPLDFARPPSTSQAPVTGPGVTSARLAVQYACSTT